MIFKAQIVSVKVDYDIIRDIMTGEPSKPEGTFGSFLEMLNTQKSAEPQEEQTGSPDDLEENIVHLLTLLKFENGGPILVDDLYLKSGIRLKLFGEAMNVMLHEGLVMMLDDDQVVLAPGVQEQL